MTNNDILRRIRFIFNYSDQQMCALFETAGFKTNRETLNTWMLSDEDPAFVILKDVELAYFLNGLITSKRGQKDGPAPAPEQTLNNNIILRKLRIALNMKDTDMLTVFKLVDLRVSKHELSALFRKPAQSQYRPCKDQFLRNFLLGLQVKFRGKNPKNSEKGKAN